jgi:tetratricopeptide (TPR) repeat protein
MTVSREPDSPALAERRSAPPSKRIPAYPSIQKLVAEAADAAFAGDEEQAQRLLQAAIDQPDSTGLAEVEEVLASLGRAGNLSTELRAQALSAYALSREIQGDRRAALEALEEAVELAATPGRVGYLASVANRADGPDAARRILEAGLRRWPHHARLWTLSAWLAFDAGELDRARDLIDQALNIDPEHAEALAILARLELVQNRPEAAIEPARGVVPRHPSLGRALLAVALGQAGRLAEDPGVLTAVLADLPDDVWVLTRFAELLLDSGRPTDARVVLDRALQLAPDAIDALRVRGVTNALLGAYPAAAEDLDRAALAGDDPWLTSLRGEVARLSGDVATAVRHFRSLDEDDEPSWVPSSLGQALVSLGDVEGGTEAYERALERSPNDVNALCGLGEILFEFGGEEGMAKGEELLRRALEIEPQDPRAHALLAEVMRRTGRLEKAVEHFDVALSTTSGYTYALASKGQTLVAMGEVAGGIDLLVQAVLEAPDSAWILDQLVAMLEAYEPDKADARLRALQRQVRKRQGDTLLLCVRRAQLAQRQARWAEAERLYRTARELDPGNADLAKEHAAVLEHLGQIKDALKIIDHLSKAAAADGELKWKRIDLLWRLGRLNEARAELERLNQSDDPPPIAAAALGEIYRMEGQREVARRLLDQAYRRDKSDAFTLASLGALELDDGNVEAAREHLRRALDLQPDHAFAFTTLVSLEVDEGRAKAVLELLDGLREVDRGDRELTRMRAMALYGLGDYLPAVRVLDDSLVESGNDASVLLLRGWIEIALGQSYRAAQSFLSAMELPAEPSGLVDLVNGLTRVDRWEQARRLVADKVGNPFVDTAAAVIWLHAGYWETAARYARAGREHRPQNRLGAAVAARALRLAGAPEDALGFAQEAHLASPTDLAAKGQLAECLLAVGRDDDARRTFQELHDRLSRRVHLDADDLNMQGWCLLRLGRTADAAAVFLRALAATDRAASVLLNLALASFLDEDIRQASILVYRAREELARLTAPTRRGVIAVAVNDLTSLRPGPPPAVREELARLAQELDTQRADLDEVVERISQSSPLPPPIAPPG